MRRFAALYSALDASSGTRARVAALQAHFAASTPRDAAWALHVLLGKQGKRLITGRRLRQICLEGSPLPDWLFDDCYTHVGDSAETIALLWQQVSGDAASAGFQDDEFQAAASLAANPLHLWMEQLLPAAAALEGAEQAQAVRRLWQGDLAQAARLLGLRRTTLVEKLRKFGIGVDDETIYRAFRDWEARHARPLTAARSGSTRPPTAPGSPRPPRD